MKAGCTYFPQSCCGSSSLWPCSILSVFQDSIPLKHPLICLPWPQRCCPHSTSQSSSSISLLPPRWLLGKKLTHQPSLECSLEYSNHDVCLHYPTLSNPILCQIVAFLPLFLAWQPSTGAARHLPPCSALTSFICSKRGFFAETLRLCPLL